MTIHRKRLAFSTIVGLSVGGTIGWLVPSLWVAIPLSLIAGTVLANILPNPFIREKK